jgi:hypothetical protein
MFWSCNVFFFSQFHFRFYCLVDRMFTMCLRFHSSMTWHVGWFGCWMLLSHHWSQVTRRPNHRFPMHGSLPKQSQRFTNPTVGAIVSGLSRRPESTVGQETTQFLIHFFSCSKLKSKQNKAVKIKTKLFHCNSTQTHRSNVRKFGAWELNCRKVKISHQRFLKESKTEFTPPEPPPPYP